MNILEGAQAGLSWSTILNKRAGYREAFADFDVERVARFADTPEGAGLFGAAADVVALASRASDAPAFAGLAPQLVPDLLRAARRAERSSRHKANPNCPTLGERAPLLAAGVLTDALPTG